MTADKSIEEIAQEYIPQIKFLEEAGSFAVFLSDRFGHYYYVTEDIEAPQELNIEKLVHPDDLEVVRRIDKKVWEFLDTLPEEEKLAYKYIYELRVLEKGKYMSRPKNGLQLFCQFNLCFSFFKLSIVSKNSFTTSV